VVLARRLLIAGGAAGFTPPSGGLTVSELAAAPEGGWSWFADPRAIFYNGTTYFGYSNRDGDVTARSYDNATETTNTLISGNRLYAAMQIDDHDNPAVLLRDSDKRLLYFYTRHGGSQMYLNVSTNPEDISSFAARVDLDSQLGGTAYTYPNPVQLLSETNDPIYLFYRDPIDSNTTAMRYSKSTDGGATWAAQTLLFKSTNRSSYWKVASNGTDRIDFGISDGHPLYDADVSIYHFYYTGGNVYQTDGTLIGAIGAAVLEPDDLTLVYDGAVGDTAWIWDVTTDGPHIAYTSYPSSTDHRANWARWTGAAWETHQIVATGTYIPTAIAAGGSQIEVYYSGGVVLDHSDPDTTYVSVGQGSGVWDMYQYVTANGGTSWTATALAVGGKRVRPVSVRNYDAGMQVLWMEGTYASYTSFSVATEGAGT